MTKKIVFIVFTFAVVAALLTLASHPESMMFGSSLNSKSETFTVTQGSVKPMMGGVAVGGAVPVPAVESDTMMMPPSYRGYGGNALYVGDRVTLQYSSQGLLVANVNDTMRQLKEYLQNQGGRILSSSQSVGDDMQFGFITAKVPVDKFDQVTTEVASKARKVMQESINSSDVTGQKVNLDDQMQSWQDQKTKRMTDLAAAKTAADKKLIQADIDRLDTMLKNAQKQIDQFTEETQFATVQITVADSERFFNPSSKPSLRGEMMQAWQSLGGTSRSILAFLVWVVVYAVIWLPIVLIFRWLVRKFGPTKSIK